MAIRTIYNASNNILFITALVIANTEEGIAIDALRTVFQNLGEATERVENKLIAISKGDIDLDDSGYNNPQIAFTSLVGDIWIIIDAIRRLELLLKHISNLPKDLNERLNVHFLGIKAIRNSFHHLDERIGAYFDTSGGSVYGDIYWRFREVIDLPEILHCLMSGVSRVNRNESILPIMEQPHHRDRIGVYDLQVKYIKANSSKIEGKKVVSYPTVVINLEETIDSVNELISHLEIYYSYILANSDKTELAAKSDTDIYKTKAITCDPPSIIRFKRKS